MELRALNINNFDQIIYESGENCIVVFSRKNCHVCKEVVPMVEECGEKYSDRMKFYRVDVEEERSLFNRFSLKGVPSILFFIDGEYHGRLAGNVEEDQLEEKIMEIF